MQGPVQVGHRFLKLPLVVLAQVLQGPALLILCYLGLKVPAQGEDRHCLPPYKVESFPG